MQEIKFVLEDFEIDKAEIVRLLEEEDLITALRIIEIKTNFNLKNSLSLLIAIYKKEEQFLYISGGEEDSTNRNFYLEKLKNSKEFPGIDSSENSFYNDDLQRSEISSVSGETSKVDWSEKRVADKNSNKNEKSNLFIEENPLKKWKYFTFILLLIIITFYLYKKNIIL